MNLSQEILKEQSYRVTVEESQAQLLVHNQSSTPCQQQQQQILAFRSCKGCLNTTFPQSPPPGPYSCLGRQVGRPTECTMCTLSLATLGTLIWIYLLNPSNKQMHLPGLCYSLRAAEHLANPPLTRDLVSDLILIVQWPFLSRIAVQADESN